MDADPDKLRRLPKIDRLIEAAAQLSPSVPRWALARAARALVEGARAALLAGEDAGADIEAAAVAREAEFAARPALRRVVNATGVVLHTNLGRAPLPRAAVDAIDTVARYSNLEFDLETGSRGSRHDLVAKVLVELCGVEDAVVVNNNAAAVMLALAGNATDKDVVVSRGELVEIGGSFRIPDVMELSGARLVEVGTTNKTRADDYARAVTGETALLLKVHQANFEIVGFAAEVGASELAEVGRQTNTATMMDLGSGALLDLDELHRLGLHGEPTVRGVIEAGIDLITFSCDKLLGGPQAGVIAGKGELVERARRHPLMRAVRPGKVTLAALAATLELYRRGDHAAIPALAALATSPRQLRGRAEELQGQVQRSTGSEYDIVATSSAVGGGAKPSSALPSWALRISKTDADGLMARLRECEPPVIARIHDNAVLFDVRCIADDEIPLVASAVATALAGGIRV